ncbi:hypothetical protein [Geosporobacter ferrireducens]|uniref:hypothetical protein n=1 Tax=Geosporobacter ferrireducens TaxID=1424294 RepID=UPI00139D18D8|nr:hypothetical protein [Geosporobacter ferrireducens]MTI56142.1 hypothetical protein [Geosporobacter ferrireducens]
MTNEVTLGILNVLENIANELNVSNNDLTMVWISFVQIIASIVFSFLLWRATCKGNEINKNNLELQKQVINYQDRLMKNDLQIKLIKMGNNLRFYIEDIKRESHSVRWDSFTDSDDIKRELKKVVEVIKFYKNTIIQDIALISDIEKYLTLCNIIRGQEKNIENCYSGVHDLDDEVYRVKEFTENLMEKLKELVILINDELKSL